jgi:predicted DNA-binding transcriptional regulator YafY
VDFRAAELLQIAQHLMTWGPTVTILAPDDLKAIMWEEIEALHAHHRPVKKKSRAK